MKTTSIDINGQSYTIATTLRVAYELQGMNNHKPYLDIFKEIEKMTIEKQIDFMYAGYKIANANAMPMSQQEFRDMCLDNLDLMSIMNCIKSIIEGITGQKADKDEDTEEVSSTEEDEKN